MSDDIETLRAAIGFLDQELREEAIPALDRLVADRDSLRKALDDRFAADQRAAKAIFAETGRTHGFPSNKEVVAFYVAEVERLEKVLAGINVHRNALLRENDSLRAKLVRAKEVFEDIEEQNANNCNETRLAVRNFLSELSAGAPAQQTQISDETCP